MHILIAPNAFKNSITASDAAHAIEQGLLQSDLDCSLEIFAIFQIEKMHLFIQQTLQ